MASGPAVNAKYVYGVSSAEINSSDPKSELDRTMIADIARGVQEAPKKSLC